jgi:hypothetical protein
VNPPALERGRRSRVERRRLVSAFEFARAADRATERVYDPAFPRSMRRQLSDVSTFETNLAD